MNKKWLSFVLSATIAAPYTVLAQDDGEQFARLNKNAYSNGNVVISGQLVDALERVLTFRAVKPDGNIADYTDTFRMSEIKTDKDGKFSVAVYPDDGDVSGEYTYYIGGRGYLAPVEGSFYVYSSGERQSLVGEIEAKTLLEDVQGILEDGEKQKILINMGCDIEGYMALEPEYRTDISEMFVDSDFNPGAFSKAVAISELNRLSGSSKDAVNSDIYNVFTKNAETMGIDIKVESTTAWLGEERTTDLLKELFAGTTYGSADEFKAEYENRAIIMAFNKAMWNEMEAILTINEKALGISLDFGSYASRKNEVYKAMVEVAETQAFSSLTQIKDAFNDAKNSLKPVQNGGSSGGSGGGSGSSSGGGSKKNSVTSVPVIQTSKNENLTVTKPVEFESGLKDMYLAEWAREAVEYLEEKGIVAGDENKNFNPNDSITREQFVTMLANAFGYSDSQASEVFDDVADNAWYKAGVAGAYNAGIVSGVSENLFGVGKNIIRQDMAAMLYRTVLNKNITMSVKKASAAFHDGESISEYAKEAVDYLYQREIINGMGDGSFAPGANATKAQAAVMICSVLKSSEGGNE